MVDKAFSGCEAGTGKRKRIKLPQQEYRELIKIHSKYGIKPRTQKWFRILTENQIIKDLEQLGTDMFSLTQDEARQLVSDLQIFE